MTDPQPLSPQVARRLATFGIRAASPDVPLHRDLVDAVTRLQGAPDGILNVALMWCWHAELQRQGEAHARAKSEYERALGRAIVRYRAEGEKSATVAESRAEAEDDVVHAAHLEYRVAERLEIVAKEALRILHTANDNWRTQEANQRAGDSFAARPAVT